MNKVVLLPTGEITLIRKGNPSGQISTTTDNNMVNTFLTAFEIAYLHKKQKGYIPTLAEYRQNVDSLCYGDDRLLAVDKKFLQYDHTIIPSMYKNIFGMWVKPENIKVKDTPDGLSFCGMTLCKVANAWYGVPNVEKILSTLEFPVRKLPDVQALWGKLVSLRILCEYASEEVKDFLDLQILKIEEYCSSEKLALPEVPKGFFTAIWTGGPK